MRITGKNGRTPGAGGREWHVHGHDRCTCDSDDHTHDSGCQEADRQTGRPTGVTALTEQMTADEWNKSHPVSTQVIAYPMTRDDAPLYTCTRSMAWKLGHGTPVVSVEGYAGGIVLSHVDPAPDGWALTPESYRVIDAAIDRDGVYAKPYTQRVDGKLTTVGLRIGEKPGHVVAMFGDRVIRHPDGTYSIKKTGESNE